MDGAGAYDDEESLVFAEENALDLRSRMGDKLGLVVGLRYFRDESVGRWERECLGDVYVGSILHVWIVGGLSFKFQMRICLNERRISWNSGKKKAGRLPLSDPPSRFLSYPKISLSEKVFVVAADKWQFLDPCQIELERKNGKAVSL